MKELRENLFNEILEAATDAARLSDITNSLNTHEKQEAEDVIAVMQALQGMPRKSVPTPLKQHRYAEAKQRTLWRLVPRISGVALASFALFAVSAGAYGTATSLPGETLHSVKTAAEQLQVSLASNPSQKASLQLKFAQRRLDEAETVLGKEDANPKLATAAVAELSHQTQTAVETVKKASSASTQEENVDLVKTLDSLTQNQTKLITQAKPNTVTKEVAESVAKSTEEGAKAVATLKQMIATSSEQMLASLPQTEAPALETITGIVLSIDENTILVDKTTIHTSEKTIIGSPSQNIRPHLALGMKVTVKATKEKDILTAQEITIIKTESHTTPLPAPKKQQPLEQPETLEPATTHTTRASFIPEDPAPQFVP